MIGLAKAAEQGRPGKFGRWRPFMNVSELSRASTAETVFMKREERRVTELRARLHLSQ